MSNGCTLIGFGVAVNPVMPHKSDIVSSGMQLRRVPVMSRT
jgi:hypothetical protein